MRVDCQCNWEKVWNILKWKAVGTGGVLGLSVREQTSGYMISIAAVDTKKSLSFIFTLLKLHLKVLAPCKLAPYLWSLMLLLFVKETNFQLLVLTPFALKNIVKTRWISVFQPHAKHFFSKHFSVCSFLFRGFSFLVIGADYCCYYRATVNIFQIP